MTRNAQQATLAALRESEESRKQAEAVGTFLVDAFKKPDPSADGKDVKVADILDQAMDGLAKGFSGSKATEGALLDALGKSYYGLGLYPNAEAALRKSELGPRGGAGARSRRHARQPRQPRRSIYRASGRTAEAIALDKATLKLTESKLGSDHPTRSPLATTLPLPISPPAAPPRRSPCSRRR